MLGLDVEATGAALSRGRFLLGPASATADLRFASPVDGPAVGLPADGPAVGLPADAWIVHLLWTLLRARELA